MIIYIIRKSPKCRKYISHIYLAIPLGSANIYTSMVVITQDKIFSISLQKEDGKKGKKKDKINVKMRRTLHNFAIDFFAFVPYRLFPFSFILVCNLSFDSLRTTARDHRQNFCFLSVLRGRPECVERESYFR